MNFLSPLPQKEPFLVSDETIYKLLKDPKEEIEFFKDGMVTNGYVVVDEKDYLKRPLYALVFITYVLQFFAENMEILNSLNPRHKRFQRAYRNWKKNHMLRLFPYIQGNELNAFYTRSGGGQLLCNTFFQGGKLMFTCDNYDIIAHETGHANLDRSRQDFNNSGCMQTKALHEAWADLTVIFSLLKIDNIRQKFLEETKGNLLNSTFISMSGENLQNGEPARNALNEKTMFNVKNEEHDQSNVFTAAIYKVLAEGFQIRRINYPKSTDDQILQEVVKDLSLLVIAAFLTVPYSDPSFSDVGKTMSEIAGNNEGMNYISGLLDEIFLSKGIDIELPHQSAKNFTHPVEPSHPYCCRAFGHSKILRQKKKASQIHKYPSGFEKVTRQGFIFENRKDDGKGKHKQWDQWGEY